MRAGRAGEMRQYPFNQLDSITKFSSIMYTGYETAVITVYRYSCTGSNWNKGELVLNREKHPIFDTTNCIQGTYMM